MNTDFTSIPVVDIAGLFGTAEEKAAVVAALATAAQDVGFMHVTGHGLDPAVFEALLEQTKRFFAQPLDEKNEGLYRQFHKPSWLRATG
ncbi:2-oxoglutarate and iron-dependent oxygenase domain-containing protein [Acetobacter papayae]|uniref:2-oxoglutarate and iron-dependent oxygenase domain-containing protein n=1 Tax=Acetobacter papayae TaxID=1076592 RepID=UPI000ADF6BA6|nr:2-oxoglutarate and iron-dependent oxygenase domain-containing protein [Acetobacter papayae]